MPLLLDLIPSRSDARAQRCPSAGMRASQRRNGLTCGCEVAFDGILIAGAGIGGLTAALALAQRGIGVTLFDQAEKLEEAGAGIQLSPNATRVLIALGLADRLEPAIVEPAAIQLP